MGSQRRKKPFGLAALLAVLFAILVFAPRENAQTVGPNRNDVLAHLNAAINWYRNLTTKVPTGAEPNGSAARLLSFSLSRTIKRPSLGATRSGLLVVFEEFNLA
jgi:hypothetical protein